MHITVGAVRGGDYSYPSEPISSLEPANVEKMLKIISETKTYRVKLDRIYINPGGEIIILGSADDAESAAILTELRRRLKEEAGFDIRGWDMNDRCHVALVFLKEIPDQKNIEEINQQLNKLIAPWKQEGRFAVIKEIGRASCRERV